MRDGRGGGMVVGCVEGGVRGELLVYSWPCRGMCERREGAAERS